MQTNLLLRLRWWVWLTLAIAVTTWLGKRTDAQQVDFVRGVGDIGRVQALAEALREGLPYVPNEVLVRFVAGAEPWQQASVLRVLRAEVKSENSRWIGSLLHIRSSDITDPEHAAELLRRQPRGFVRAAKLYWTQYLHPQ
jgi:hypothetical protein